MNIWLKKHADDWGIALNQEQLDQFQHYYQLLIERNKVVNLTRITEENEVYGKHFLDSLSLATLNCIQGDESLIDIGTGAGFPAIPLKIAFPRLEITLLDSLMKRVSFLTDVVEQLGLRQVNVVHGRAESLAHDPLYRESFDIATARAVARLNVLSEYCIPFVKIGGSFIVMKGGQIEEELQEGEAAVKKLGCKVNRSSSLELPEEMGERRLILISKQRRSPESYPRRCGVPNKTPIE